MLFFLHGEDNFRSKEKLIKLRNAFLEKNPSSGVVFFDFSEKIDSLHELLESFVSGDLFSAKKMIVIENLLTTLSADYQKIVLNKLTALDNITNNSDLVIVLREDGKPKKNLSLYKYLEKNSKKQEFNLLDFRGLEAWAVEYINLNYPKISFSKSALSLLISFIGSDLFLLKNELEKISNFKNEGEVSEKEIDLLVNSRIQSSIFQAIESLLNNNKKTALLLLHEQIEKGEDPFYILSMYVYQVRSLLKISSSLQNGALDPNIISRDTGIHPYVVRKLIAQTRLAGISKIRSIFQKLQRIDLEAKTGKIDIKTALDRFIIQI